MDCDEDYDGDLYKALKDSHVVELMYMSRKDTLRNVERLVIGEELVRLKSATNGTLDKDERHQFWSKWKTDNYALLVNQLGFKTQDSRFLHGVFFTPSFAQKKGVSFSTKERGHNKRRRHVNNG